ncbi:MAG: response regulator [Pseudomonadota bacterium]
MRILSVDDDPIFLDVIAAELGALGYNDVTQVSSAADAMTLVQGGDAPFDCFLLDIDMPETDGVALCNMLRQNPASAHTPIIMITVRADMGSIDRAFGVGATDYLTKPIDRRTLRGRMQMVDQLTAKSTERQFGAPAAFDISVPLPLTEAPRTITYLAMQNYLLKLNAAHLMAWSAIGIRVDNAEDIHANRGPEAYPDMLLDVAEILAETFKNEQTLIAHAGYGDFVVFTRGCRYTGVDELADRLDPALSTLADWYRSVGDVAPRLRVGAPVRRGLFSFSSADELLDEAIENAAVEGKLVGLPAKDMPAVASNGLRFA